MTTPNPYGVCLEPKCTDEAPSKELPSLGQMVKNLMGSTKDIVDGAVHGEGLMATDTVYKERLTTCMSCDRFIIDTHRCAECGCFMKAKAMFKKTYCPLDKWHV